MQSVMEKAPARRRPHDATAKPVVQKTGAAWGLRERPVVEVL